MAAAWLRSIRGRSRTRLTSWLCSTRQSGCRCSRDSWLQKCRGEEDRGRKAGCNPKKQAVSISKIACHRDSKEGSCRIERRRRESAPICRPGPFFVRIRFEAGNLESAKLFEGI